MRIHITGASGSGTTTLGAALALESDYAHLDADDYFWLATDPPYTQKRERSERVKSLASDLASKPDVVLSGSIVGWGAEVEDAFDLIVFLYIKPELRLERLRVRETARFGRVDPEFLSWAAQYDEGSLEVRSLALHQSWLAARTCPVLELSGDMSVAERVAEVLKLPGRTLAAGEPHQ